MDLFTYLPPFNTTTLIKPMNEEEEEAPLEDLCVRRSHLARRGTLLDLKSNVQQMLVNGQLIEVCAVMHRLRWMSIGGQLKMLCIAMRKLLWKMLRVLTPKCFCISIGSRKCVTQIVMLTRVNESSCRKNIANKFETLTVKHVVPNVNWIAQTKVEIK